MSDISLSREFRRDATTRAINSRISEVTKAYGAHFVRQINIPIDLEDVRERRGKCWNCGISLLIFSNGKETEPGMFCRREVCIMNAPKFPDLCLNPGKVCHESRQAAQLVILRMTADPERIRKHKKPLQPYLCLCGYYHIGHRRNGH